MVTVPAPLDFEGIKTCRNLRYQGRNLRVPAPLDFEGIKTRDLDDRRENHLSFQPLWILRGLRHDMLGRVNGLLAVPAPLDFEGIKTTL